MKNTPEAKKIASYMTGLQNTAVGKQLNYFSLPDPDGKAIDFARYKGKYVWVLVSKLFHACGKYM